MAPETDFTPSPLSANAFSRTGYAFAGWNSAADGSGTAYADGASRCLHGQPDPLRPVGAQRQLQRHLRRQRLDGRPHGTRDQLHAQPLEHQRL